MCNISQAPARRKQASSCASPRQLEGCYGDPGWLLLLLLLLLAALFVAFRSRHKGKGKTGPRVGERGAPAELLSCGGVGSLGHRVFVPSRPSPRDESTGKVIRLEQIRRTGEAKTTEPSGPGKEKKKGEGGDGVGKRRPAGL
ncbi:hypothetical protein JRQ81_017117, partial [Phrynocephalus forsythii]